MSLSNNKVLIHRNIFVLSLCSDPIGSLLFSFSCAPGFKGILISEKQISFLLRQRERKNQREHLVQVSNRIQIDLFVLFISSIFFGT